MKRCTLAATVAIALAIAGVAAAAPRYMSVDEVRPGMVGMGRTVFEGDRVEEFTVRILGVLRNTAAPRRNLVIARLEGGPLAATGVIAGMSGSPVYIDGRLLGAVAYSLGQFPKEPIAGITPIEEMIEAAAPGAPRRRPAEGAPGSISRSRQEKVAAALRRGVRARSSQPFADSPPTCGSKASAWRTSLAAPQLGVLLRPIATPLALGGFSGAVRELVRRLRGSRLRADARRARRCRARPARRPGAARRRRRAQAGRPGRREPHHRRLRDGRDGHGHRGGRRGRSTRSATRSTTSARPSSR